MFQPPSMRVAMWLPVVLVLGYAGVLLSNLGNGVPSHWDEYLTLVRSQSFEQTGDWWAVHLNGAPNFKKPPLQYWMTAGLMKTGLDGVVAGRTVSAMFAIGLLGAVVLLVFAMFPPDHEKRGVLLCAVLALAMLYTSSFLLWAARSCLLDSGMAFFATFTLAALLMTERHRAWWLAAGFAAGLGSLQKSHFTAGLFVLFGLVMLVLAYRKRSESAPLRQPLFAAGAGLTVMVTLAAFWPVLQTIRFGSVYLDDAFGTEVADRLKPSEASDPLERLFELTGWLSQDSGVLMCFGVGALLLLPLAKGVRGNFRVLCMVAFVLCSVIGLVMASGNTYERYVLAFTPVWAGVAAVVWTDLVRQQRAMIALPVILFAGSALQWPAMAKVYAARDAKFEKIRSASAEFGRRVADSDLPVVVKIYGLPASAFLYWSGLDRNALLLIEERLNGEDPEALEVDPEVALQGVSHFSQVPLVRRKFETRELKVEREVGPYVIWRAEAKPAHVPVNVSPREDSSSGGRR